MGNKKNTAKSSTLSKDDQVVVITGNNRGKVGKVISVNNEYVVVEGVNVRKKHMKATQQNQKGKIIDFEAPIHCSNLMHYHEDRAVRVKTKVTKEGEKILYYLHNGEEVHYKTIKKAKS